MHKLISILLMVLSFGAASYSAFASSTNPAPDEEQSENTTSQPVNPK